MVPLFRVQGASSLTSWSPCFLICKSEIVNRTGDGSLSGLSLPLFLSMQREGNCRTLRARDESREFFFLSLFPIQENTIKNSDITLAAPICLPKLETVQCSSPEPLTWKTHLVRDTVQRSLPATIIHLNHHLATASEAKEALAL